MLIYTAFGRIVNTCAACAGFLLGAKRAVNTCAGNEVSSEMSSENQWAPRVQLR